jgi:hypothetical protein
VNGRTLSKISAMSAAMNLRVTILLLLLSEFYV